MNYLVISNRKDVQNALYFKGPQDLEVYLKLHPEVDTLLFAFWSFIVEKWMLDTYKVYGLHTGPLLEGVGRGGSPIENLQLLGVKITTLCCFEMTEKIDAGRVILAIPIRINQPKEWIVSVIDAFLPTIVSYITREKIEIPKFFKRIQK